MEQLWALFAAALRRPAWLRVDRLLGEKGIPQDSEAGREQCKLRMEQRRAEENSADYERLRRDWVLGSEEFRRELLAAASEQMGLNHFGAERQETEAHKPSVSCGRTKSQADASPKISACPSNCRLSDSDPLNGRLSD